MSTREKQFAVVHLYIQSKDKDISATKCSRWFGCDAEIVDHGKNKKAVSKRICSGFIKERSGNWMTNPNAGPCEEFRSSSSALKESQHPMQQRDSTNKEACKEFGSSSSPLKETQIPTQQGLGVNDGASHADGLCEEHRLPMQVSEQIAAIFKCPICNETMKDAVVSQSGNLYCEGCIEPCFKKRRLVDNKWLAKGILNIIFTCLQIYCTHSF
jgi:hypothetical protein